MNILGVDYGKKKIGLALSGGDLSRPYTILRVENQQLAIKGIKEICEKENIERIVIGFPQLDKQSKTAKEIELFARELGKEIDIPTVFQDETLSSKEALAKMIEAGKGMKKRREDDAFAAAIILQDYIDG